MRNLQEIIGFFVKNLVIFKSVCLNNDRAIIQKKINLSTLSDPGYLRILKLRGLYPHPYDLKNYCINLYHILYVYLCELCM